MLDLGREGPRVVEAGVVPHREHEAGDPGGRIGGRNRGKRLPRRLEAAARQGERSERDDDEEGQDEEDPEGLRAHPTARIPSAFQAVQAATSARQAHHPAPPSATFPTAGQNRAR